MTEVQKQIRRLRREKELSAVDVAREVGISRQALHALETQERDGLEVLSRVAAALGRKLALVPIDSEGGE